MIPSDSSANAIAKSSGSLHGAPVSWMPIGIPRSSNPIGHVMDGRPAMFCGTVYGIIALRSGTSLPNIVTMSGVTIRLGAVAPTGLTRTSANWNALANDAVA